MMPNWSPSWLLSDQVTRIAISLVMQLLPIMLLSAAITATSDSYMLLHAATADMLLFLVKFI